MLRLVKASSAQIVQAWENNHVSWGVPLSREKYRQRETFLGSTTAHGCSRTTWVLVPAGLPDDTLDFVAACETYPRPCLVTDGHGAVAQRTCVSIASVFTPEQHRNHGYAGAVMRSVMGMIADPQAESKLFFPPPPPADAPDSPEGSFADHWRHAENRVVAASTLYSEVGSTYYARFGWLYQPSFALSVYLPNDDDASSVLAAVGGEHYTVPIFDEDIAAIMAKDAEMLRDELRRSDEPSFCLLPTKEIVAWFNASADFNGKEVPRASAPDDTKVGGDKDDGPVVRGAIWADSGAFALWFPDFVEHKLVVLRLRATTRTEVEALLLAAVGHAAALGIKKVTVWCDDPAAVAARGEDGRGFNGDYSWLEGAPAFLARQLRSHVQERGPEDSLACVALLDAAVTAEGFHLAPAQEQARESTSKRRWVANEKYAWV
ncbi:hypothetical protein HK405_009996 [Cladochytrium tenue]|nr:hypothetical protein HK405_009996 [Cladochytrium tenue]